MKTWALAPLCPPGILHCSRNRIHLRRLAEPGALKTQRLNTKYHHKIAVRSKINFVFSESCCSRGVSRGDMVLEGGGFHKEILDITRRRRLPTMGGRMTVCFKDNESNYKSRAGNSVTFTTFNVQAPPYKRMNSEGTRESCSRECWMSRNKSIIDMLLMKRSSVICLQEFWIQNMEFVNMYEERFQDAGYEIYKLGRTNKRDDGLFIAIRKDHFQVMNNRELLFNDFGDRVAQLLHLRSTMSFLQRGGTPLEVIVVNTHLLFPHNSTLCLVRLRQVYKIMEYLETFKAKHKLPAIPVILCGDWNGSKRGNVYKFLRSQGFVSAYDTAHKYSDSDVDAHRWISHLNHRGNKCGVDFIWLLNPNKNRQPLRIGWMDAVFGIIKYKVQEAGLNILDAFSFFKSEHRYNDFFTLQDFGHALQQLGLTEEPSEGLTSEEIEDLMVTADLDGNGIIDNEEFQKVMLGQSIELTPITVLEGKIASSKKCSYQKSEHPLTVLEGKITSRKKCLYGKRERSLRQYQDGLGTIQDPDNLQESEIGFDVKGASLYPPEVENCIWPKHYQMSDHALLSAVFQPVKIPKRQKATS